VSIFQREALSALAGIELARFELAKCHAGAACARTSDHGLDGDEIDEFGTGVLFRKDADADKTTRAGQTARGGQTEYEAVFATPDERIAGSLRAEPIRISRGERAASEQ
jgi:hypothetical protein